MTRHELEILTACSLFRGMSAEELAGALARVPFLLKRHEKRALIRLQGEPYEALLILLEGTVAGEFQDAGGRVMRVETLSAPSLVASSILFARENHLPVNITALTEVRLLSLPKTSLLALCRQVPGVLERLLSDMGSRTAFLADKLRITQFATLRQKVAGYLLERSRRFGSDRVPIAGSKKTLAELFGAARPSLSRTLGELAAEGAIRLEGKAIRILDREALQALLGEAR